MCCSDPLERWRGNREPEEDDWPSARRFYHPTFLLHTSLRSRCYRRCRLHCLALVWWIINTPSLPCWLAFSKLLYSIFPYCNHALSWWITPVVLSTCKLWGTLGRNHLPNVIVSVFAWSLPDPSSVLSCTEADASCGSHLATVRLIIARSIPAVVAFVHFWRRYLTISV